jgi:hypothetical protein
MRSFEFMLQEQNYFHFSVPPKILKVVETGIIKIKTFDAIFVSGNDYKMLLYHKSHISAIR